MKMDENTFARLTELENGLQQLIDEVSAKKDDILRLLESGLHEYDWYELGYDMANGDAGTGWMKVLDIEEYRGMESDEIVEDVEGWIQTDSWNHEVGALMRKYFEAENENHDDCEALMTARDDWVSGYIAAIYHKLEEVSEAPLEEVITGGE
jgi:hypothetical protein